MRRLSGAVLVGLFIALIGINEGPENVPTGVDIPVDKGVKTVRAVDVDAAFEACNHLVVLGVVDLVGILPLLSDGLVVLGLLLDVSLCAVARVKALQRFVTRGTGVG